MKKLIYIILLIFPCMAYSIMHRVIQDGSGDYTQIQAALNVSSPGDTVLVYPGRYFENLIIQTDGISLISLEALTGNVAYIDSTVVDGTLQSPTLSIYLNRQDVSVRGLSFTNGKGIGIGIAQTSTTITNCKIYGCIATSGGGVVIAGSAVHLSGVDIYDNYAMYLGGGLYASTGTSYINTITFDPVNRCSIYNNRSGSGQDIYIQNAVSDLNIYLDTFSVAEPTTYYAIYLSQGLNNYQMQIDILHAHHQEIDSDLYVSPTGDDANDGLSPGTPLKTIHEAIYRIAPDSLNQNAVHLLPGTYSRTDNDQVFPIALKSWTIVQGSGIENTEVIGELHPLLLLGSNPHNDVFLNNYQAFVTLSDLSITTRNSTNDTAIYGVSYGSANLIRVHISNVNPDDASAVWLWLGNDHDSIWRNVTVENVLTPNMGLVDINGAMSGSFTDCKFRNATSTYSSASVWAYPLVSIRGDEYLSFDNCEFSNLTISDDNSHAIQVFDVQFPQQSNNFRFSNCLFSNISSPGGAMIVGSSNNPNMSFTNCTFGGNESNTYTLMTNGNVDIRNSIFYNDSPSQISVNPYYGQGEYTTLNIDHSFIRDGYSGIQQAAGNTINYSETNITGNPLFLGGDDIHDPLFYSLSALSPCINSGTPDTLGLFLLPYDLAGNQRVWDGCIDMGCFEFGAPPVGNDDPGTPVIPRASLAVYPNPFATFTNLRVSLPSYGRGGAEPVNAAHISIYNIKGQLVKTIALDPHNSKEQYSHWDGRDTGNLRCSSGIYLMSLVVDGVRVSSKKVTLLR